VHEKLIMNILKNAAQCL